MGNKNYKSSMLRAGVFLIILATLFFSGQAPARAGFFDQASSYFSDGGKTLGDATGQLGGGAVKVWQKVGGSLGGASSQIGNDAVKIWQNVGDGLGEAAEVVAKNTSRASDAFLGGIKNFGETIGGLGNQVTKEYDAALGKVKQGTDKAVEAVINVLPKKASVKITTPKPAVKKDIQKPSVKEDVAATEVKNLPTAPAVVQKEETKKQSAPVTPKEIIIYSNKANQESVQPLVASAAKAASSGNATFETVKSKGNVFVGDDVVLDAATGVATLKGIKIIGTVDFSNAEVKGFKQTVVNNYSSGPPMVVYNSTTKENESWQTLSGNVGGVSTHWSVGKDLTVSQNATVASILTIGSTSANGSLIVNGTGSFTGAATFTGTITLSSGATMSGDLTVNGNTTLGDASGDTVTINGRLSTLNVSDGSTTSSLAKNSFYLGDTANNGRGVFYIDSSGNVSTSGTVNLSNTTLAVVSSTAANLRLAADGSKDLELWTNAVKRFYINSSGNTFASGTLQVTNTSTLYNDLLVGASTESIADSGFVFTGNDLYVEDQLGVNGNAWFDGSIRASSTLLATDAVTFYGNSTLGDAVGDLITLNGTINSAIRASSTLLIGTAAGTDNFFVNNNNTYVATSTAYGTAYSLVVGNGTTGAVIAGGHVSPSHTGLFDLGRNGLGWNNIYTSSTIYAGAGGTTLSTLTANNLAFAGSTGVVSSTAGNLRLAADGANQLQLWTNNNQRMYIDSSGNTFASGTLQVTNTSTLYNDLLVGASTESIADSGFIFNGNDLYVHDQLGVNGNAWFDGSLRASSTLLGTGNATFYGDTTLGDAAGDTITINGRLGTLNVSDGLTATSSLANNSLTVRQVLGTFGSGYFNVDSSGNVSASGTITAWGSQTASSSILNSNALTLGKGTNYNSGMFSVDSNGNVSASGTVRASAGTSAIPSYSFQGDSDTGIYNVAANQIGFVVNGLVATVKGDGVYYTSWRAPATGNILQALGADQSDGSGYGMKIGNEFALTKVGDKIIGFFSDGLANERAYINASGTPAFGIQTGYNAGLFNIDISGNVSASGSLKTFGNVTSTGHIYPAAVNTVDLGGLNIAFRDIYASSSINVGASGASSTFKGNYLALTNGTSSTVLNGSSLTLGSGTNYGSGMFNVDSNGNVRASGTIRASAGSNTAPSFSFINDTSTGIYNVSANALSFVSGGTAIATVNANGLAFVNWRAPATGNTLQAQGADTTDGSAYGMKIGNESTFFSPTDKIVGFFSGALTAATERAYINASGTPAFGIQTGYNAGLFNIDISGNTFASGSIKTYGNVTSTGNLYALTGTASTSILNGSSLQLGVGASTGYGSGMFNVDSNGNVNASGTIVSLNSGSLNQMAIGIGAKDTGYYLSGGNTLYLVFSGTVAGTESSTGVAQRLVYRSTVGSTRVEGIQTDSATAVGVQIGNQNTLSTTGAKIVSFGAGAAATPERAYIDLNGGAAFAVATNYNNGKFNIDSSGNVSASGSLKTFGNVTSTGHIYPAAVNTVDLGGLNIAFRDIYASSSINVGASGASSTFKGNYLALTDGTTSAVYQGGSLQFGQATNYLGGAVAINNKGNVSASGTLVIYGDEVGTYNLTGTNQTNLKIWIDQGTPAGQTASTTFTSNLFSQGTGVGLAGFVFNTKVNGGMMSSSSVVDKVLMAVQNNGYNQVLISASGSVYANSSFIANQSGIYGIGDVAEHVNLVAGEIAEAGDVVIIDANGLNQYRRSESAYAKNVAGVISDSGAFIIGASGEGRAPLALAGLVNVKVTAENGPIAVGDYLVTASKPGYAMKYDADSGKSAGLVGMALEPLATGEGKIKILVNKGLVNGGGGTTELTVSEDEDGALSASSNLNMKGKSILNIAGLNKTGDLWYIDETGLLVAKEIKADTVQAKKFVVEKKTDAKQTSVGEATILNNSTLVTVENELVTSTSKIFITFRSNPQSFWWISKQEDGKFEVSLSKEAKGDLIFDYWIVGVEEAPVSESEVAPAAAVAPVETPAAPITEPAPVVPAAPVTPESPAVPVTPEVPPAPEPVIEAPIVTPSAPEVIIPAVEAELVPAEAAPVSNEVANP